MMDEKHEQIEVIDEKLAGSKKTQEKNPSSRMEKFKLPGDPSTRTWMMVITILLAVQVLLTVFQVVNAQIVRVNEERFRSQVVQGVATYTANVDELTAQMLTDYKNDVYNNSKVDTTAKQQVMGTEYNFNAILLLIKQNSRLMEMLSQLR